MTEQGRMPTLPAADVLALAAVERIVAHVTCGAVARCPEPVGKFELIRLAEESIARALKLHEHAFAMVRRDSDAMEVSSGWVLHLAPLDQLLPDELLMVLAGVVLPFLRQGYEDLARGAEELYDARLLRTLHGFLSEWIESPLAGAFPDDDTDLRELASTLERQWVEPIEDTVHIDLMVPPPLDRIPRPARPDGVVVAEPGAPFEFYDTSRASWENILRSLHEHVDAEICSMELVSRCSYEHPDMPWGFHAAIIRHAADEARHARIFNRLLVERGGHLGDDPVHNDLYTSLYEFEPCEPGSKRELAWRLIILSTCLEGFAIDQFAYDVKMWDTLDEPRIAQACEYVLADELTHAENGLNGTVRLCGILGLDPAEERATAYGYFVDHQRAARAAWAAANPERAADIAELRGTEDPDSLSFAIQMQDELRVRAGFTADVIEQYRVWVYESDEDAPAWDVHSRSRGLRP